MDLDVGDIVSFELSGVGYKNTPRWHFNDDTNGEGVWTFGEVISITDEIIEVAFTIDGMIGTGICRWPNYNHPDYIPWQWDQEGYLRLVDKPDDRICECGSEKVFGAAVTGHSSWCPKYDG